MRRFHFSLLWKIKSCRLQRKSPAHQPRTQRTTSSFLLLQEQTVPESFLHLSLSFHASVYLFCPLLYIHIWLLCQLDSGFTRCVYFWSLGLVESSFTRLPRSHFDFTVKRKQVNPVVSIQSVQYWNSTNQSGCDQPVDGAALICWCTFLSFNPLIHIFTFFFWDFCFCLKLFCFCNKFISVTFT